MDVIEYRFMSKDILSYLFFFGTVIIICEPKSQRNYSPLECHPRDRSDFKNKLTEHIL